MTVIKAFKAFRPTTELAPQVAAHPYDVLNPNCRQRLVRHQVHFEKEEHLDKWVARVLFPAHWLDLDRWYAHFLSCGNVGLSTILLQKNILARKICSKRHYSPLNQNNSRSLFLLYHMGLLLSLKTKESLHLHLYKIVFRLFLSDSFFFSLLQGKHLYSFCKSALHSNFHFYQGFPILLCVFLWRRQALL